MALPDTMAAPFLSTLPVRGATMNCSEVTLMTVISIHAPREGSDGDGGGGRHPQLHISIHAPREGSDGPDHRRVIHLCAISIHAPREGSDRTGCEKSIPQNVFLSTLPVRGATAQNHVGLAAEVISIHAPREGSDMFSRMSASAWLTFLSTLPVRGATLPARQGPPAGVYFYPRSP